MLDGGLHECTVKGLAVEKVGQGVALAVVQQALKIQVQPKHATYQKTSILGQRLSRGNLQNAAASGTACHGEYRDAGAIVAVCNLSRRSGLLAQGVPGQWGQQVQLGPGRVTGRRQLAGFQLRTGQPAFIARVAHHTADGRGTGLQQVVDGADQGDVKRVAVAKGGQISKLINEL